jgi:ABC-type transporter Mla MlaB component
MMRVTRKLEGEGLVIWLEGDLSEEVVDLVRKECRLKGDEPAVGRLYVDLARLGQADEAGLRLLRELRARGDVKLLHCSSLLHTLMNGLP